MRFIKPVATFRFKYLLASFLLATSLLSGCSKTVCPAYMTEKEVIEMQAKYRSKDAKRNKSGKKRGADGKKYRNK
jgi:hypothetical protein